MPPTSDENVASLSLPLSLLCTSTRYQSAATVAWAVGGAPSPEPGYASGCKPRGIEALGASAACKKNPRSQMSNPQSESEGASRVGNSCKPPPAYAERKGKNLKRKLHPPHIPVEGQVRPSLVEGLSAACGLGCPCGMAVSIHVR